MSWFVKVSFLLLLASFHILKAESPKQVLLNVPIPIGQEASGVKIPYYDDKGKLRMNFQIEAAERISEVSLLMKALTLETYDDAGRVEMEVVLPRSVLDLKTRIISSDSPGTVSNSDFKLTGDALRFDTTSRRGDFTGKVKMLIYNINEMSKNGKE